MAAEPFVITALSFLLLGYGLGVEVERWKAKWAMRQEARAQALRKIRVDFGWTHQHLDGMIGALMATGLTEDQAIDEIRGTRRA